jgi:hypothetical protein
MNPPADSRSLPAAEIRGNPQPSAPIRVSPIVIPPATILFARFALGFISTAGINAP